MQSLSIRNVMLLRAPIILIALFFVHTTCTSNSSQGYISYDDGMRPCVSFVTVCNIMYLDRLELVRKMD